jgi:hypothetical protein
MVNASMDEHMHNMNDMFSLIKEIKMYLEYINNIHMYEREPSLMLIHMTQRDREFKKKKGNCGRTKSCAPRCYILTATGRSHIHRIL